MPISVSVSVQDTHDSARDTLCLLIVLLSQASASKRCQLDCLVDSSLLEIIILPLVNILNYLRTRL